MAFGQRILIISSLIIFLWMGVGILMYKRSFQFTEENKVLSLKSEEPKEEFCKIKGQKLNPGFWRKINLYKKKVPKLPEESESVIVVQSNSVTFNGIKVHYIYAKPKELNNDVIPVLLLHGQSYSSDTWNELGTVRLLAALGYYPIAVDLPGYGKTPGLSDLTKGQFIDDLITALNIKKPVLISPSMSGLFSLRFLVEHPEKLGGFIPISPVRTSILDDALCENPDDESTDATLSLDCQKIMNYMKSDRPRLNCLKVPTLVIWGQRDRGENSAKLCLLPESQGAEIPDGKHSAYLNNPEIWHKLLYNFLNMVNATRACQ